MGGRVEVERTADAVVYTVVGPARELDYLAGVLRAALRPRAATEALLRGPARPAEERLAEWETAPVGALPRCAPALPRRPLRRRHRRLRARG